MKKTTFVYTLTLSALIACIMMLTACVDSTHEHIFESWKTVKEATCAEEGSKERRCSCGEVETASIPAIGHKESEWIIDKDAAQKENGAKHTVCTVCGVTVSEKIIPAIGSAGLAYTVNSDGKTCTVTGIGTCTDTEICIGMYIDVYTVTGIGAEAFNGQKHLVSVIFPASIKHINTRAFQSCTSLVQITIPDTENSTSLGGWAFAYCTGLKNVTLGVGVSSISQSAFAGCSSLESISLPSSINTIGGSAFAECKKLKSITMSEGITAIDVCAFQNCTSLESITIPDSVTDIDTQAMFYSCTSLKNITIGAGVKSIGKEMFYGCTSLESITIPDSVTSLGDYSFKNCTNLKNVKIGNSVTSTAREAFSGCKNLTDVTFGVGMKTIARDTFMYCTSLESITIPDGVTSIEVNAFFNCTNLKNVTIPGSVTSIGGQIFYGCTKIEKLNFNGTKNQWNAITKTNGWDHGSGKYTVYCTDGNITK